MNDAEQCRPHDLDAWPRQDRSRRSFARKQPADGALICREAPQTILNDDDGAVDDEPEVERTETHQVSGDPALHHAGDGEQHRKRNTGRRKQRRAQVAEQQEQNGDDQERAFEKILLHSRDACWSTSVVRS